MSTRYNNGSHYENHQRAAELHDSPRMPIGSPSRTDNRITLPGTSIHGKPWRTPRTLISIPRRLRLDMASPRSDMMTSRPSLMNCGKLEVVQTDRRKKTGFMPQNNCDPAPTPADPALGDHKCPKCGAEMEPIEMGAAGLSLQELQLCPGCYLVTWSDQDGPHVRQGVPVKPGAQLRGEPGPRSEPTWPAGEPEEC